MNDENRGLVTLPEVFLFGRRCLQVPNYQRSYSWEKSQRDDLRGDLAVIANQPEGILHYTGTLVLSRNPLGSESYDIVDGQQRLTTLMILISQLLQVSGVADYMCWSNGEPHAPAAIFIERGREQGNTVRPFRLNSDTDEYFVSEVLGEPDRVLAPTTKAHRELLAARDEFREWVAGDAAGIGARRMLEVILTRLGFLLYIPKRSEEIGLMFEVINNRGKELSELEKVKNYLVYFGTKNAKGDVVTAVDRHWGEILRNLNLAGKTSNAAENAFLHAAWVVFADHRKAESHRVYDNLKERWPAANGAKAVELVGFVDFLRKASSTYAKLFARSTVGGEEESVLERLAVQRSIASVMPLVIAVMLNVAANGPRVELLEIIEKLNFRFYGCPIAKRADAGQGTLFHLARAFHAKWAEAATPELLISKLYDFVAHNAPDAKFVQALTLDRDETFDYGTWHSLKFFLASYEQHLLRLGGQNAELSKMMARQDPRHPNEFFHLEHIWATAEKTVQVEGDHYLKRRLGNFVLLEPTLNISASNESVDAKMRSYASHEQETRAKAKMLHALPDLYREVEDTEAQRWQRRTKKYWLSVYSRFMDRREHALVTFALERWRVPYDGHLVERVEIDSSEWRNEVYRIFPPISPVVYTDVPAPTGSESR